MTFRSLPIYVSFVGQQYLLKKKGFSAGCGFFVSVLQGAPDFLKVDKVLKGYPVKQKNERARCGSALKRGFAMDGKTTVKYLQSYIRQKDYHPELSKDYFLKLSEEVGELSRAMRKGQKAPNYQEIKGTIDEELWDVIYYAMAIANLYDIDLEQVIKSKAAISQSKYPSSVAFEENR